MTNALLAKPEVILQLDRPRKWKFGYYALCQLEKKIGKVAVKEIDWSSPGFSEMLLFLWAGLLREDPTLTEEQVADMIDNGDPQVIFEAIRGSQTVEDETGAEEKKEEPAIVTAEA